jgi:hypothetical protein
VTRWAILALLPVTAMIGAAADRDEPAPPAAAEAIAQMKTIDNRVAAEPPPLELSGLRRPSKNAEPADAFEARSWYVPPPPPPAPPPAPAAPPPAPTAPPLPFSFLGQYEEDGRQIILLMRGERMLLVKAGEVIDGTYRVEGIRGRYLGLVYLPLGIRQTLDVEPPG